MSDESKPITQEHYAAIGKVMVSWSMFERCLKLMAYGLTTNSPMEENDDRTAAIAYEGMQTRALIGILESLVQMRFPAERQMIRKFGERALKAKAQRDVLGHSIFERGSAPDTIRPILAKTVGGLRQARGDLTVQDIEGWAQIIGNLTVEGLAILVRWGYLIAPNDASPHKDEPQAPV
jgi:hypothetical protein